MTHCCQSFSHIIKVWNIVTFFFILRGLLFHKPTSFVNIYSYSNYRLSYGLPWATPWLTIWQLTTRDFRLLSFCHSPIQPHRDLEVEPTHPPPPPNKTIAPFFFFLFLGMLSTYHQKKRHFDKVMENVHNFIPRSNLVLDNYCKNHHSNSQEVHSLPWRGLSQTKYYWGTLTRAGVY